MPLKKPPRITATYHKAAKTWSAVCPVRGCPYIVRSMSRATSAAGAIQAHGTAKHGWDPFAIASVKQVSV